jgi:hypothetical protein
MSEFTEDKLFREDFTNKLDPAVMEAAYTYNSWIDTRDKFRGNSPEELIARSSAIMAQLHLAEVAIAEINSFGHTEQIVLDEAYAVQVQEKYEAHLHAFGTHAQVVEYAKFLELRRQLIPGELILAIDHNQGEIHLIRVTDNVQVLSISAYNSSNNLEYNEELSWVVPTEDEINKTYDVDLETPVSRDAIIKYLTKNEYNLDGLSVEAILEHSKVYIELGLAQDAASLEENAAWNALQEIKKLHSSTWAWELDRLVRRVERLDGATFKQLSNYFARKIALREVPNEQTMLFYQTVAALEVEKGDDNWDELSTKQKFERSLPLMLDAYDQGGAIVEREKQEKEDGMRPIQVQSR